jgi:hypothetical protein
MDQGQELRKGKEEKLRRLKTMVEQRNPAAKSEFWKS